MNSFKHFLIGVSSFLKPITLDREINNKIFLQQLNGLKFKFSFLKNFGLYKTYLPDSFFIFQKHNEFNLLLKRFTKNNKLNNGGDIPRLISIILNCKQILDEKIDGDFAELGVWRGNTAAILAYYASLQDRKVYLFDTFEGFKKEDLTGIDSKKTIAFDNTSIQMVKDNIGEFDKNCIYVKGFFPDSLTQEHKSRQYAIVSLDCDLYAPTKAGLNFFYSQMPIGGLFLLHDYSSCFWEGSKLAIDEFCKEQKEYVILVPDKSGSAFIRKSK